MCLPHVLVPYIDGMSSCAPRRGRPPTQDTPARTSGWSQSMKSKSGWKARDIWGAEGQQSWLCGRAFDLKSEGRQGTLNKENLKTEFQTHHPLARFTGFDCKAAMMWRVHWHRWQKSFCSNYPLELLRHIQEEKPWPREPFKRVDKRKKHHISYHVFHKYYCYYMLLLFYYYCYDYFHSCMFVVFEDVYQ